MKKLAFLTFSMIFFKYNNAMNVNPQNLQDVPDEIITILLKDQISIKSLLNKEPNDNKIINKENFNKKNGDKKLEKKEKIIVEKSN